MFCFSFYAYVLFELCRKVNYYPRIFKKYDNNFIADGFSHSYLLF